MRLSERAPAAGPRSLSLQPFLRNRRAPSVPVAHLILVSQLPMTKTTQLIVAAVMLFLAGCASVDTRAPVPVVTIVSARDVGSEVEVTARYAKVTAGKQEINVGLGYTPSATRPAGASGFYMILHTEVLSSESGEVVVRLKKAKLKSPFAGVANVNISTYPHASPWRPLANDHMKVTPQ